MAQRRTIQGKAQTQYCVQNRETDVQGEI